MEAQNKFSASEHGADRDEICAQICHHKWHFEKEINIQRQSLIPSNFKEKTITEKIFPVIWTEI